MGWTPAKTEWINTNIWKSSLVTKLGGPMVELSGPMSKLGGPMPKLGGPIPKLVVPIPKLGGPMSKQVGPIPKLGGPIPKLGGPMLKLGEPMPTLNTCFRPPCTCEWLKNAKTADSMLLAAVNFFFFDQIISSPTILLALGNTQCVQNHFEVLC